MSEKLGLVADGIYRRRGGMLFERPWLAGKRTWRTLFTKNLKLAKEELHKRRSGLLPAEATPAVEVTTCGDVIRRYKKDNYPDAHREQRPDRTLKLESRYCSNLLSFWDKIAVDAVSNATCDRYCDFRVKIIHRDQPARKGTRAVDLDLNTLSNAFSWATRVELTKSNPVADRPLYHSSASVKHCRETMPNNSDELHKLAGAFILGRSNSSALGWQVLIEGLTGLRTCEVLRLRTDAAPNEPGWITEDGKFLCVRRVKKQHAVNPFCTITDGLRLVLDSHATWKKEHFPSSPWYFPSSLDQTKHVNSTSLAHALLRMNQVVGHKITSHGLRAFYVLVRRSQGATDAQIAAELGHTTGGSTVERVYGGIPANWLYGGGPNLTWLPKQVAWEKPHPEALPTPESAAGSTGS